MSAVEEVGEHEVRYECTECPWEATASMHDASFVEKVADHEDSHLSVGQPRSAERTYVSGEHPAITRGRAQYRRFAIGAIIFGAFVAAGWVYLFGLIAGWW